MAYTPKNQQGNQPQHGRASYRRGCRCNECRNAEASYRRQYRKDCREASYRREYRKARR